MVSKGQQIPPHLAHLAKDIVDADAGFAQAV
jgi:lipoic acid synthetase